MTPDTQLFQDVFNASPIGIVVETLEGQPLFINRAFCSMLGFSEEQLRLKHCVDFSPAEDAEKDWQLFQQLREGSLDHYQLEKRYFRRDGSLMWGRLSLSSLKGRSSPMVIAMVEDITDKKTAEEARFRHTAILKSSEDAIISKNLDAIIVSWNEGAQHIFGYTEAEAMGQPITILIPPNLWDEQKQTLEKLRAGGHIEHYETVRMTQTGTKIDVSITISPIKDSTGELVGFCEIAQDITERKRAEKVLEEANRALEKQTAVLQAGQELLKIFVRNVPAGVAMLDREMRYLEVSDRWCADYGVEASQLLGVSHYEVFPNMPERWREVHRRALDGETLRADEDRWDRPNGTTWVRWEVRPWKTPQGSIGGIVIFAEDITHSKQTDEALRTSEELLRLAAQIGKMYAYSWDVETDEVLRSPQYATVLGIPHQTRFTRKQLLQQVHPEDRANWICSTLGMTPDNPSTRITYRVLRPKGVEVWLEKNAHAFFDSDGRMLRVIGMVADVTERKRAEEGIRESEKQFRTIVETTNEGVWLLDSELHTSYVNRQMAEMLGYEPGQIVGRSVFDFYFAEDVEHKKQVLSRRQQGLSDQCEERLLRKDGNELWVRMAATPVFKDNGEFGGALAMMADITERKRAEKALADMSRKLIQAQEQERARIGRELHDDINQRLAMLALELEQLQDNYPEVRSRVQELRKETAEISNDVQALSHELHSSKLEYLGVVAGMKSWCKEFSERQSMEIDFKTEVSSTLPLEVGLSLFRVIQEALHNAQKHSGVKRVELQLREDSGEIHLVVSDLGRGFDLETAMQGQGLGLTSMGERVRLMNGTISIESKPMCGTTIHVRVPLESKHAAKREAV
jgi:PAS domain S-box-containing protein